MYKFHTHSSFPENLPRLAKQPFQIIQINGPAASAVFVLNLVAENVKGIHTVLFDILEWFIRSIIQLISFIGMLIS